MRTALAILFLSVLASFGATYYVRTDGHDTASGANNTSDAATGAWLTQQHAWDTMQPGDTTLVSAGVYDRPMVSEPYYDVSVRHGTPSNRITMRAQGAVTNTYGTGITHSWITFDGFTYWGPKTAVPHFNVSTAGGVGYGSWVNVSSNPNGDNPTNVWVFNCTFNQCTNVWAVTMEGHSKVTDADWTHINGPQSCIISNCTVNGGFYSDTGGALDFSGYNNLLVNCRQTDIYANWGFMFSGLSNTVRGCIIEGVWGDVHPDIFQCFMTGGNGDTNPNMESYGHLIENGVFGPCAAFGGLLQAEYYANPAHSIPPYGSFTFRNNVFHDITGCSISIPGTSWINNTFRNAYLGFSIHSTVYPWYRLDQDKPPGAATNTTILNNLFINGGYSYELDTNWNTSIHWTADYNYFVNTNGASWASIATLTSNLNSTTFNNLGPGDPYGTTPVGGGGSQTASGWYYQVAGFNEAHGFNTGVDPKVVAGSTWNGLTNSVIGPLRPMLGSPVIDAGTNVAAWTSSDIEGTVRPIGSAYDIGAFEFDPALRVHYDWSTDFTVSTQMVMDVTGYGHPIYNMENGTNWLTVTTSPTGRAGHGYTNGTIVGGDSATYTLGSAGVITNNLSDLTNLPTGTISFWVRWATNAERRDRIFDCGYAPIYSLNAAAATNSWMIQYGSSSTSYDPTCTGPSFYVWTGGDSNSTNSMIYYWTNELRDSATWWMNTVTWTGGSNVLCYQNGALVFSNYFPNAALVFDGAFAPKWLAFGVYQHEEPPTWRPGVSYADTGFQKSDVGDTRIYNRQLSASEVASLYAGGGAAVASGGGGSSPAAPFNSGGTATATTVHAANTFVGH